MTVPDLEPSVNNNSGHFYGAWSVARSWAQCAIQKDAEKCINTYNRERKRKKSSFRPYDCQPCKSLHTAILVNKPKLSVTKHDQTLIWAHMYDASRYTDNTKMYNGNIILIVPWAKLCLPFIGKEQINMAVLWGAQIWSNCNNKNHFCCISIMMDQR